jgi:predicted ribosome quality control (RQC) complex YloA/Tae2 family protein
LLLPPLKSQFDKKWAAFEHDMQSLKQPTLDPQEMYAYMMVAVEPELVPGVEEMPDQMAEGGEVAAEVLELEQKVSEKEECKQKVQKKSELIMDQLLEEEHAQEEAEGRGMSIHQGIDLNAMG